MNAIPGRSPWLLAGLLVLAGLALVALGLAVGSTGWRWPWSEGAPDAGQAAILWEIRLPRSLGAWLAGALLGLAGAVAQGLFRNPLADPYLLGSASGASLGVAVLLAATGLPSAATGWLPQLGITGAAFAGALGGVLLTLALARGVQQTLRLLLAGVIVGVVLGALSSLLLMRLPEVMRTLQGFMLGSTGFLGWSAVQVLALSLVPALIVALALAVPLGPARGLLVAVMALATGAAVAQVGLVAFVGLVAPHLVRLAARPTHRALLPLSALAGGALLLAADVASRWVLAPQELPVGVLTAVLGGGYLLWLMHRRPL